MANPPITRFTSLAVTTAQNSGNPNNGLYAPELNNAQIDSIPIKTKRNGGIWYNTDIGQLEAVVQNKVQPVPVGIGGGNVVGPIVSAIDNLASFGNNTGTLIADSGIAKGNVVIAPGVATATKLLAFTGVGKNVQESALVTDNLVTNTGPGVENNIVIFDAGGGKVIKDSGVSITQVANPLPLFRFANALVASNATVNEIGNIGHIKFINDVSSIYVDTLTSIRFFPYDGDNAQVCSVFTSEIGKGGDSTSRSALLEIHSDSGALLLSRMDTAQRTALSMISGVDGTNGMLLFNTESATFDGYDGTNWRKFALFNTDNTLTVADPLSSTNAATKAYVDAAVSGIPTATITLTGNVTGSGVVTSPIATTLNMTLDQIKVPVANLNLNSKNIINLLNPTLAQDAATKNYVDTRSITLSGAVTGTGALGTTISTTLTNITTSQITNFNTAVTAFRLDQFAAPTASVSLGSQKIINLLNPTLAQDAATKNYVDTSISGAGIAPAAAKYIIQTANATLTNAQILGSLATGLLKNTTTTGVLTIGIAGTDYYSPGNPTRILDDTVNFFIGTLAGNLTLTGTSNTGVGITALDSLTNGTDNTAAGSASLKQTTTGIANSSFGARGLTLNTIGSYNSAFGVESLYNNSGFANYNSSFGYRSLYSNNLGLENSSFGAQSLASNINGDDNCSFGSFSSNSNTIGAGNSSFGRGSLRLNTSSFNSAFGINSGSAQAIYNNCLFLGAQADASVNNLTNAIAIGYQASVGASNSMVLGGTGGNQLFVGIGLTPNAQLQLPTIHANRKIVLYETANNDHQVIGLGTAAGTFRFQIDNTASNYIWNAATSSTTSNELMRLTGTGFLGIGTSAPNAPLQFANTIVNRKIVLFDSFNNDHQFAGLGVSSNIFRFQVASTLTESFVFYAGTSSTTSNELMRLTGAGFLGVGTSAPNAPLQFSSLVSSRKIVLYEFANNDHQVYGLGVNTSIFRFQVTTPTDNYVFYAGTSTTTSNELMRLTGTGRLGIGTAVPDQLLTVNSSTPSKIGGGLWSAFSDARIKDVVGDYEHGLAEIIQIQTRKFKYNDRSGYPESEKAKINIGIIAQEIEDIFPECIVEKIQKDDISDMRMYDGTALTYALINAVKELNNEIKILKQQINN